MVLDVSKYQEYHPGGEFVVNQNIGRDISKFFYGGYAQENFVKKPKTHFHSNIARY
jgi:cytochrome b involved in lipid metabolism